MKEQAQLYRVTYRDGSTRLVDGQDVVSWHHGDVAYIEREDVVRVDPRELLREAQRRSEGEDCVCGEDCVGGSDCLLAHLYAVIEELEGSQPASEE